MFHPTVLSVIAMKKPNCGRHSLVLAKLASVKTTIFILFKCKGRNLSPVFVCFLVMGGCFWEGLVLCRYHTGTPGAALTIIVRAAPGATSWTWAQISGRVLTPKYCARLR